jgi:hypothetical protein
MKRFFLVGLTAALALFAWAPTQSKADEGFRVYVDPGYQEYRPYYYGEDSWRYRRYRRAEEYRWRRWHHRHHYYRDYDRDYDRD